MRADLAQPGQRRQHVDRRAVDALLVDLRQDLATRGLRDGAVQTALQRREIALEFNLDALGQFGRHVFLGTPQHERLEPRAQDVCGAGANVVRA